MAQPDDPVSLLSRAVDQAGAVLAGIGKDQADLPTPLPAWSVGRLVDHVIEGLRQFTVVAQGGKADFKTAPPEVEHWLDEFRARQRELIDAWKAAGDLSEIVELPGLGAITKRFWIDQATAEFTVHCWDLACATGRSTELDPDIAAACLEWGKGALRPEFRSEQPGAAFGPEVAIGDDAPIYERLAAFFGRDPARC